MEGGYALLFLFGVTVPISSFAANPLDDLTENELTKGYLGCWENFFKPYIYGSKTIELTDNNSHYECRRNCIQKYKDTTYIGLEHGYICRCGTSGPSKNSQTHPKVNDSLCEENQCPGDVKAMCGGTEHIKVFQIYTEKLWRDDGRCGESYPLPNGTPGQCDPSANENEKGPCCSNKGYCGNTSTHCNCSSCVNYAEQPPNLTTLEANLKSLQTSVLSLQTSMESILEMVHAFELRSSQLESCLSDITSSTCPSPPNGKTSVAVGISGNTAALADKCDASTCSDIEKMVSGVGQWSSWSECTGTCGNATKNRTRPCLIAPCQRFVKEETVKCQPHKCGYVGCYDNLGSPKLYVKKTLKLRENNSRYECQRNCINSHKGATYIGLEDGYICRCGNSPPPIRHRNHMKVDDSHCEEKKCPGDKNTGCGGTNYIRIFHLFIGPFY